MSFLFKTRSKQEVASVSRGRNPVVVQVKARVGVVADAQVENAAQVDEVAVAQAENAVQVDEVAVAQAEDVALANAHAACAQDSSRLEDVVVVQAVAANAQAVVVQAEDAAQASVQAVAVTGNIRFHLKGLIVLEISPFDVICF